MAKRLVICVVVVAVAIIALLVKSGETDSQRWEREENFVDPGDDPRMKAAQDEARRRWPEFLAAFATRQPGDNFAVKARFADGRYEEWMWVQVASIDGETLRGTLDNEPVHLGDVKVNQPVTVLRSDTDDWLFQRRGDATMAGAFTTKVLVQIQNERNSTQQE